MGATPQLISNFTPPSYNIDILEGAVMHAMTICGGAASDVALNHFVQRYSAARGKRLKANYTNTKLLPRLLADRKIFRVGQHMYSLNPMFVSGNKQAYDAFWVYLEFMQSLDVVASTMAGFSPAQISFVRNNAIYHIVRVEGNGQNELMRLMRHEIDMKQRMKDEKYKPKEKVILVFDSTEQALACQYKLINIETMYCIIQYPEGEYVPKLRFCRPEDLNGGKKNTPLQN